MIIILKYFPCFNTNLLVFGLKTLLMRYLGVLWDYLDVVGFYCQIIWFILSCISLISKRVALCLTFCSLMLVWSWISRFFAAEFLLWAVNVVQISRGATLRRHSWRPGSRQRHQATVNRYLPKVLAGTRSCRTAPGPAEPCMAMARRGEDDKQHPGSYAAMFRSTSVSVKFRAVIGRGSPSSSHSDLLLLLSLDRLLLRVQVSSAGNYETGAGWRCCRCYWCWAAVNMLQWCCVNVRLGCRPLQRPLLALG